MDDRFLHEARREPRAEFASGLRRRLAQDDEAARARIVARRGGLRRGLLAFAPVAAAVLVLVLFPEVRAGAQAFLELFRVRNFVAVNVDPDRVKKVLHKDGMDPLALIGEHVETSPAEPSRAFDTPADAFLAAGYPARVPAYLPEGVLPDTAVLIGAHEGEVRVNTAKINELLTSLGISDLTIPPALDGARIGVRVPRAVAVRFQNGSGKLRVLLVQAPHPEVSVPPGLERARIAEIGLRIAGLSADEARRFADRIDWNSTVLVPVPIGRCTFREVEIRGHKALLIEQNEGKEVSSKARPVEGTGRVLLWSDDERVFALSGNLRDYPMLQMAESIP